jgi:hypothetical protein
LSSAFLDDNSDSVEFVKVTSDGPDTRNATSSSDDDVKFVKVEPGLPHHLSPTRNHVVSFSQISDCALPPTKRRAEEAPAAYGGAERKRRANYGRGYSIALSFSSDDCEPPSIVASSKDGDGDNNVNKDSRKDDCGSFPGTKRCADEESETSVDGDGVKRTPTNYDQLPKAVTFRGKTSKGNPVPQTGVWSLDNYRASDTSIVGEPLNATEEAIVEALMNVATSHPYSGHKKRSKSSKVGSPWGHSFSIRFQKT